ncbi:hypothetical protein [Roseateles sp. BYS96W]|uniref:PXPV repeat-containing protein n=1 Tax=Pelomonas nitida TaxID=3299027 RepID=A0ABW7G528_9BURK
MIRSVLAGLTAGVALLAATAAHAETRWSIGINLPPAGVVVSNGPGYYVEPAPVYYAPPPPPPVYVPAPRYVVRDVYYAPPPPPVIYETRRWDHHHSHHGHRDYRYRDDGWRDGRDGGPYRGR